MTKSTWIYWSLALLCGLLLYFSCKSSKKKGEVPIQAGVQIILARVIQRNGAKDLLWCQRYIYVKLQYDSAEMENKYVIDTIGGQPYQQPVIDSVTRKQKKDSLGNLLFYRTLLYDPVPKDSISWHVENISQYDLLTPDSILHKKDSLLKK